MKDFCNLRDSYKDYKKESNSPVDIKTYLYIVMP